MRTLYLNFLFALFLMSGFLSNIMAQAPEGIIYQAEARDAQGKLYAKQTLNVMIAILEADVNGSVVYEEWHKVTTSEYGIFTLIIGQGDKTNGYLFENIDWGNHAHFLNVQVEDPKKGRLIHMGTSQLLSVPYALHAKTAEAVVGPIDETDPVFTDWNRSTGISITSSQISDFDISVENNSAVLANTAKNSYPDEDKNKLEGVAEGAEVNVNADWVATAGDAMILNKPTLSEVATSGSYEDLEGTPDLSIYATKNMANQHITNLANPVNTQDAATKAYVDALMDRIDALEMSDLLNNGFTDIRDGNHYNVVKIGNQVWMAENLAFKPSSGNYWAYDNNSNNVAKYGYLYDWHTAPNVCPTGWHLPSDTEWTELTDDLGDASVAGGTLKESGTTHWLSPNTGATNESGFTALPGGYRNSSNGTFYLVGTHGNWWSSTEDDSSHAWSRRLRYNFASVYRDYDGKAHGFSVRCVRDN